MALRTAPMWTHARSSPAARAGSAPPSSARLLDDGWRVVVPWIVERELERVAGARRARAGRRPTCSTPTRSRPWWRGGRRSGEAPLRGVVNLVGGFAMGGRVHETPIEEFEQQFRLNLRPTYLVTAAALPHLLDGRRAARSCASARRAALQPFSGAAGYIASKAAVIAFAQAVAAEYKNDGIRCNAILPERDRHAGQPGVDAEGRLREVGQAGGDRRRDRPPAERRLTADQRRGGAGLRPRLSGQPCSPGPAAAAVVPGVQNARKSRRRAALL